MKSRRHLTPYPVVDKNGKLTTVHKKDAVTATVGQLPTASITPPTAPQSGYAELIGQRAEMFNDYAPDILPLLIQLATTGSEDTQIRTSKTIMLGLTNQQGMTPRVPRIVVRALSAWHASSLLTEEDDTSVISYQSLFANLLRLAPSAEEVAVRSGALLENFPYWRGRTILAHSELRLYDQHEFMYDFIKWVDERTDTKQIIALMHDRSTSNPRVLEPLLLQQDTVYAPLHNGLL